jgi:CPA2 family monovalent cation:H+ antiporter-2
MLSAVKNTLAFSSLVIDQVLPKDELDPLVARVSRRALRGTLLLGATLGVGVPTVAVLLPVIGGWVGTLMLGCLVVGVSIYLYRSANALDHEFESGAEKLAALMGRQVTEPGETELSDRSLLPGLDHARTVTLVADAYGVGRTLGEVNLRVLTGATVIAIRRQQEGVTLPTGHEPLRPFDMLALIGTEEAIEKADTLLSLGPDELRERESRYSDADITE